MKTAFRALGALVALTMSGPPSAFASAPGVDVRTWQPSTDPNANLVIEPSSSPGPWVLSASSWLHYENDPIVLRSPTTGATTATPLENQLGLDLCVALGLGSRAALGARIPMFLYEQGSGGLLSTVDSDGSVPTAGFGDLALTGKGTLIDNAHGGFGLATLGDVTLPTGSQASFMSDRGPTVTLRLLADLSMQVASLQASLGYEVRTSHVVFPDSPAGVTVGDAIPWTFGVVLRPSVLHFLDPEGRQSIELALHGSLPGGPVLPFGLGDPGSAILSPVLLALSDRVGLGRRKDVFILAGADIGLDRALGVPSARVVAGFGFRFASHDQDHDGIDDDKDACPDLPEDFDGYEDADGCPEVDNDQDGIVDREDACPNVPGAASPDPRKNGCPPDLAPPLFETTHDPSRP